MKRLSLLIIMILCLCVILYCASKKGIVARKSIINPGSRIMVIVNHSNNIKNVILAKFMKNNFIVKAFNASDLYTVDDIYDIKDFKKVAHKYPLKNDSVLSFEKTAENIYKLHIYNYEINKAEALTDIRNKYGVQYLVLMDLREWQKVSWARAIDLFNMEVVWLENYPARYSDTLEDVIDHFIISMTGKK